MKKNIEQSLTIHFWSLWEFMIAKRLKVSIKKEDDIFVAVAPTLNTYGYGNTRTEACRNLFESILEYYEALKKERELLGVILKQDYEYLKHILEE